MTRPSLNAVLIRETKKILLDQGNRFCTACKQFKELSEFYENSESFGGIASRCKVCQRGYHKTERGRISRRNQTLKKYGLTLTEYAILLQNQNGLCLICCQPESDSKNENLPVDHCHVTNKIRGLLCSKCNRGLGLFNHDVELLRRAINHLEVQV